MAEGKSPPPASLPPVPFSPGGDVTHASGDALTLGTRGEMANTPSTVSLVLPSGGLPQETNKSAYSLPPMQGEGAGSQVGVGGGDVRNASLDNLENIMGEQRSVDTRGMRSESSTTREILPVGVPTGNINLDRMKNPPGVLRVGSNLAIMHTISRPSDSPRVLGGDFESDASEESDVFDDDDGDTDAASETLTEAQPLAWETSHTRTVGFAEPMPADPVTELSVFKKSDETLARLDAALTTRVLQPDDLNLWRWETLVYVCLLYYALVVPLQLAVQRDKLLLTWWGHFGVEALMWVVFTADVGVRLCTAYYDEAHGKLVDDSAQIRAHLLRTYLLWDVLAAVPVDTVVMMTLGEDYYAGWPFVLVSVGRFAGKAYRARGYFRVITPVKLSASAVRYQYQTLPNVRMFANIAWSVNLLAVAWVIINQEGTAYSASTDKLYEYNEAIYWVLYTLTTVGYGDIPVDTALKRWFACFLFVLAVLAQGTVISLISNRMSKGDVENDRIDSMMETLMVLKEYSIPEELASEVLAFQHHKLHADLQGGFLNTLSALPDIIKCRVGLYVRIKFLCNVDMFKRLPTECLIDLAKCLDDVVYEPEEFIIMAGEEGNEMYFLSHGFVQVLSPELEFWSCLKPGAAFGEIALLTNSKRLANISTLTYCELYRLSKRDFWSLIVLYPALRQSVAQEMRDKNIMGPTEGTTYNLRAAGPFDKLGIIWSKALDGTYVVSTLEDDGAAARAGVVMGMRLIAVEGIALDELETPSVLDELLQVSGVVEMRMIGPSANDEELHKLNPLRPDRLAGRRRSTCDNGDQNQGSPAYTSPMISEQNVVSPINPWQRLLQTHVASGSDVLNNSENAKQQVASRVVQKILQARTIAQQQRNIVHEHTQEMMNERAASFSSRAGLEGSVVGVHGSEARAAAAAPFDRPALSPRKGRGAVQRGFLDRLRDGTPSSSTSHLTFSTVMSPSAASPKSANWTGTSVRMNHSSFANPAQSRKSSGNTPVSPAVRRKSTDTKREETAARVADYGNAMTHLQAALDALRPHVKRADACVQTDFTAFNETLDLDDEPPSPVKPARGDPKLTFTEQGGAVRHKMKRFVHMRSLFTLLKKESSKDNAMTLKARETKRTGPKNARRLYGRNVSESNRSLNSAARGGDVDSTERNPTEVMKTAKAVLESIETAQSQRMVPSPSAGPLTLTVAASPPMSPRSSRSRGSRGSTDV